MHKIGKKAIKLKKTNKIILRGGRYLGQGAFGCVITPALQCGQKSKKKSFGKKRYSISRNNVSKIISRTDIDVDDTVKNEINVSNKLKHIDPSQKYFLYIKENCKIRDIPNERSNVASVRFLDEESLEIQMLDRKKLDKHHCEVDLKLEPRNLILSDGGKELGDVLRIYAKAQASSRSGFKSEYKSEYLAKYADEIEMAHLIYKNFKHHARVLLEGIYKLHQNNITQRDIKIENLMIDWTSKEKRQIIIRIIDFGLSEILDHQYISSISNIHSQGTEELIPPDITIASYLKKNYKYFEFNKEHIINKIFRELEKGVRKTFIDLNLDSSIIKPKTIDIIYNIYKSFTDNTILSKYFGDSKDKFNGYVQKADLYALGITFYEILHKFCVMHPSCSDLKKNPKLTHLLKNMIELDPNKRYNVLQCLQHPYFN